MSRKHCFFCGGLILTLMAFVCGCQQKPRDEISGASPSQTVVQPYQIQSFDTGDKVKTLRAVIAALQDLDFVIEKADVSLGLIHANTVEHGMINITVTVNQKSSEQMVVGANAVTNGKALENPDYYQSFFDALAKALSLTAHTGDKEATPVPDAVQP